MIFLKLKQTEQYLMCEGEYRYLSLVIMSDEEVITHYHARGECEQFHSKIKTDMDASERLPSGKFDTNELIIELTILAYHILRMIGRESVGRHQPRHKIRTVISSLIRMVSHVMTHAGQRIMGLGQSNVWRYAFAGVYDSFANFWQ